MNTLKKHPYPVSLIICTLALGLFLVSTNPGEVKIGLLVIPVILLFFIAFCVAQMIISVLRLMPTQPRKRRIVALVAASFISLIMILQSTGGISGVDVLLLGLILLISAIYIDKF
jgi:hypothetical protein